MTISSMIKAISLTDKIQLIVAVIALSALVLSIIPYWPVKSIIYGKITGVLRSGQMNYPYIEKDGTSKNINGIGYTLNILITVLNKNFNVKNINVYIQYEGDNKKYEGTLIRANEAIININGTNKKLHIPNEMDLIDINVLEKEKINSFFIRFIIDSSLEKLEKTQQIKNIEILFTDYRNKKMSLILNWSDIDAKRLLSFDNKYWEVIIQ